jgi:hypothetical protein
MACPLHQPPWTDFQVEGEFPGQKDSAAQVLSRDCMGRFYAFRIFQFEQILIDDSTRHPPNPSLHVDNITVEVERIPVCYACGLYAKRIARDSWSVIDPAFYLRGDRTS